MTAPARPHDGTPTGVAALTPTRRGLFLGVGATAAVGVLAACSSNTGGKATLSTPSSAETVAQLADVPVGGAVKGTLASGAKILVTQPTAGEVHVFSAICTHQGCTVIPDDERKDLYCPCHGSEFDLASAKVLKGPAPSALQELPSSVKDGAVVVGG
ncbi:ubiquinol-cytochrome c reductase iron-sulfur subunit [Luteimicrobium subarcticum]|uniref:Cytochrome bc1 complex Rieske iron-sulfur subunit n=1 Tax=Luteimicrobium subarcticum TaxID=620910 RepID=A0A2M8WTQ5_9MICO|nr:Rieske (2Fe-2S) protein [Luteimicrobium subarcticum]PJI94320.1 Rieske Fe-S protein [Luteimicrobium subarcticum]